MLNLEIVTDDRHAEFGLMGSDTITVGDTVELAPGVTAAILPVMRYKSFGIPETIAFALDVAKNIPASVTADVIWSWLSSRLKREPQKLTIDRLEVGFEEGKVKRLVQERITRE